MRRYATLADIDRKYGSSLRNIPKDARDKAVQAFDHIGKRLSATSGQRYAPGQMMNSDAHKMVNRITAAHIGKMVLFFYDAKHKDTLPYWDRVPLVIPIELYKDGFLGLNFHYLHPLARAYLLDFLLRDSRYKWFMDPKAMYYDAFARRRIQLTYQNLKSICQSGLFKPCVKRYLYTSGGKGKSATGHVKSRFYLVDPCDWMKFLFLPIEHFEKKNRQQVWQESAKKVFG